MIQLKSTNSLKLARRDSNFEAGMYTRRSCIEEMIQLECSGSGRALGQVSFKLMTRHPNLANDEEGGLAKYKAVVEVLLREIREGHHILKWVFDQAA